MNKLKSLLKSFLLAVGLVVATRIIKKQEQKTKK